MNLSSADFCCAQWQTLSSLTSEKFYLVPCCDADGKTLLLSTKKLIWAQRKLPMNTSSSSSICWILAEGSCRVTTSKVYDIGFLLFYHFIILSQIDLRWHVVLLLVCLVRKYEERLVQKRKERKRKAHVIMNKFDETFLISK